MPDEWLYARNIRLRLAHLAAKTQIFPGSDLTANRKSHPGESGQVLSVIIAAQHSELGWSYRMRFFSKFRQKLAHVIQDVLPNAEQIGY